MTTKPPPLPSSQMLEKAMIVAGFSILLFIISLALPAMYLDNGDVWYGAHVLMLGWMGIFFGILAWLASPLLMLIYPLLLFRRWIATFIVSALAVVIACHSFSVLHTKIPLDEGNVRQASVLALGPAFYVWLAALSLPGIGALLLRPDTRHD